VTSHRADTLGPYGRSNHPPGGRAFQ
jgi:hypothetical protein